MKQESCTRIAADIEQIYGCKIELREREDSFVWLSDLFQLAGNSVRLKILYLLNLKTQLCVCDLSDVLEMNVAAISQHLKKLKDKKVILSDRKGQTIYYTIAPNYLTYLHPYFEIIQAQEPCPTP